ncbi:molybdate ABC transporter substrate-binding protein [Vibrio sp. Of7-15]|uniref:molybdate ABC transporter substrate-binding protein n=1 Tax=Vibrio sp. Of7-15 TaxID=2724879 RepID=UPI001EF2BA66|nr:molybdate ABC transporter substrate-binding protein [Vibrio sp. Of7-15]MCG7495304.1 molybdate ABC transporter substrate-binding protein [Vibrio sp. Of7-15]
MKNKSLGFVKRNKALLFATLLLSAPSVMAKVNVFAASSLTNALNEISKQFERQTGTRIRNTFAGSSALARQINNGAPADIYLSANTKWMMYLDQQQVLEPKTKASLLANSLVVIAPSDRQTPAFPSSSWPLADYLEDSKLALADPAHVPAGIYAQQALGNLGVWETVKEHIAAANNVRSALVLVERGEAPLGIVYKTDGMLSKYVDIVAELPASSHDEIQYPMAIIKNKARPEVLSFYNYLRSDSAQAVFQQYGFKTLSH